MSIPVLTPDIEIDIEEELGNEDFGHAIAYCPDHQENRPLSGTIVQGLCGRLFRVNWENRGDKCPECAELFDVPNSGRCWICGIKA